MSSDHHRQQPDVPNLIGVANRLDVGVYRLRQVAVLAERNREVMVALGNSTAVTETLIGSECLTVQAARFGDSTLQMLRGCEVVGDARGHQRIPMVPSEIEGEPQSVGGVTHRSPLKGDNTKQIETTHPTIVIDTPPETGQSFIGQRLTFAQPTKASCRSRRDEHGTGVVEHGVLSLVAREHIQIAPLTEQEL